MLANRLRQVHLLLALVILVSGGCSSVREYIGNGFKVGPNYRQPVAAVAKEWIDSADAHVSSSPADLRCWWTVFRDPCLNSLVENAAQGNLTLREAGYRVLRARAARAIVGGNLFPQQQAIVGGYSRDAISKSAANTRFLPNQFYSGWDAGFNLTWELDFWGRFRRAIEAADANLDASVANYGQVMVTLLGDIAATYTEIRTLQQRIALARQNVDLQRETFTIASARFRGGLVSELDVDQATSTLAQTEALIPQLELNLRRAQNQLCILLGVPPADLIPVVLGGGPIPTVPEELVVGIPADLLRRRPDVRRAEREIAAQSAEVGVATAELYPHLGITGTIGYSAEQFADLLTSRSLQGGIGPSFQWNVLNYGRLLNNIRLQDARLAELIVAYQNTVLTANAEAENGIARFLRGGQRSQSLARSVAASQRAEKIAVAQYRAGIINFNWVAFVQENLVEQQDLLARAQGEVVLGVVETYRALGGGWQTPVGQLTGPKVIGPIAAGLSVDRSIEAVPAPQPPPAQPVPMRLPHVAGQSATTATGWRR